MYNLQAIRESPPDAHGCSDSPIQNQNPKAVSNSAFPRNCFNALRVGSWRTPRQYTHSRMVFAGLLRVSCCSRVTLASKSWLHSKVSQSDFGTDALLPILLLRPWNTLRHLLRFGTTLPTPFLYTSYAHVTGNPLEARCCSCFRQDLSLARCLQANCTSWMLGANSAIPSPELPWVVR